MKALFEKRHFDVSHLVILESGVPAFIWLTSFRKASRIAFISVKLFSISVCFRLVESAIVVFLILGFEFGEIADVCAGTFCYPCSQLYRWFAQVQFCYPCSQLIYNIISDIL